MLNSSLVHEEDWAELEHQDELEVELQALVESLAQVELLPASECLVDNLVVAGLDHVLLSCVMALPPVRVIRLKGSTLVMAATNVMAVCL